MLFNFAYHGHIFGLDGKLILLKERLLCCSCLTLARCSLKVLAGMSVYYCKVIFITKVKKVEAIKNSHYEKVLPQISTEMFIFCRQLAMV